MTSLHARPNIALVVVDVQNNVVANADERDRVASISAIGPTGHESRHLTFVKKPSGFRQGR